MMNDWRVGIKHCQAYNPRINSDCKRANGYVIELPFKNLSINNSNDSGDQTSIQHKALQNTGGQIDMKALSPKLTQPVDKKSIINHKNTED